MKEVKPIYSTSVTKQIAEQLKGRILSGNLQHGDQLPTETELARAYGVSRPTIREAFKRLAAQNLIRSKRGPAGGTFVNAYQVEDASEMIISSTMLMLSMNSISVENVIEVRHMMQRLCCELVIAHWTEEAGAEIDRALANLKNTDLEDTEFCDADVAFHRAIVSASGNRMLEYLMYGVNESLVPVMNMMIVHVRDRSIILNYYTSLREALFKKDMSVVEDVLSEMMTYLRKQVSDAQKARALSKRGMLG